MIITIVSSVAIDKIHNNNNMVIHYGDNYQFSCDMSNTTNMRDCGEDLTSNEQNNPSKAVTWKQIFVIFVAVYGSFFALLLVVCQLEKRKERKETEELLQIYIKRK